MLKAGPVTSSKEVAGSPTLTVCATGSGRAEKVDRWWFDRVPADRGKFDREPSPQCWSCSFYCSGTQMTGVTAVVERKPEIEKV